MTAPHPRHACKCCHRHHCPSSPHNEDDKEDDAPSPSPTASYIPPHVVTMAPHARLVACQHHRVNTLSQNGAVTMTHVPKRQWLPHPHPLTLSHHLCSHFHLTPSGSLADPSPSLSCYPALTLTLTSFSCHLVPVLVLVLVLALSLSSPPLCAISAVLPTLGHALSPTLTSLITPLQEHLCSHATSPPWQPLAPLADLPSHTAIPQAHCHLAESRTHTVTSESFVHPHPPIPYAPAFMCTYCMHTICIVL